MTLDEQNEKEAWKARQHTDIEILRLARKHEAFCPAQILEHIRAVEKKREIPNVDFEIASMRKNKDCFGSLFRSEILAGIGSGPSRTITWTIDDDWERAQDRWSESREWFDDDFTEDHLENLMQAIGHITIKVDVESGKVISVHTGDQRFFTDGKVVKRASSHKVTEDTVTQDVIEEIAKSHGAKDPTKMAKWLLTADISNYHLHIENMSQDLKYSEMFE